MLHGLPEKSPLAFLITGAAVVAFAASNLFVFGVSLALHQNLSAYFEILDYVRITPAWALSALCYYCLMVFAVFLTKLHVTPNRVRKPKEEPKDDRAVLHALPSFLELGFLAFITAVIFLNYWLDKTFQWSPPFGGGPTAWLDNAILVTPFFLSRAIAWGVGVALVDIEAGPEKEGLVSSTQKRSVRYLLGRKYLWVSVLATSLLSFAFFSGLIIDPAAVRRSPLTRVILAEEIPNLEGSIGLSTADTNFRIKQRETMVQGRVIFYLSHSLLLLGERHETLLAIPVEKIERTETPKYHYTASPTHSPIPSPTLQSDTQPTLKASP